MCCICFISYHQHHLSPVLCVQQAPRSLINASLPRQSPNHLRRRDGRPLTNMAVASSLLAAHLGNDRIRRIYKVQHSSAPSTWVLNCVQAATRALVNQLHSCLFCQLLSLKQHAETYSHACPESQSLFANATRESIKTRAVCVMFLLCNVCVSSMAVAIHMHLVNEDSICASCC